MARRVAEDRRVHRGEFDVLNDTVFALKNELDDVKKEIGTNTQMTQDILLILKGFTLVAKVAKWITAVGGAIYALWHGFLAVLHFKP